MHSYLHESHYHRSGDESSEGVAGWDKQQGGRSGNRHLSHTKAAGHCSLTGALQIHDTDLLWQQGKDKQWGRKKLHGWSKTWNVQWEINVVNSCKQQIFSKKSRNIQVQHTGHKLSSAVW